MPSTSRSWTSTTRCSDMPGTDIQLRGRTHSDIGPLQAVLASISNKWVTTVFEHLSDATELSYSELHRRSRASRKMLSATLRNLVRDGLVQRRAASGPVPKRVYYRLTDLGRSLDANLDGLRDWANNHMHTIETARQTGNGPAGARCR